MRDLDTIFLDTTFARLARSSFRSRFGLGPSERAYLQLRGMMTILDHAASFVESRLAPALPANDGRQTPMRGHPVFVAQHATATCCRSCLAKWHGIPAGTELSQTERRYVLAVIERWLLQAAAHTATASGRRIARRQLQLELPVAMEPVTTLSVSDR